MKNFVTLQVSSLLDSSLPPAVRKSFVLVTGCATCSGTARNQHMNGRAAASGEKAEELRNAG